MPPPPLPPPAALSLSVKRAAHVQRATPAAARAAAGVGGTEIVWAIPWEAAALARADPDGSLPRQCTPSTPRLAYALAKVTKAAAASAGSCSCGLLVGGGSCSTIPPWCGAGPKSVTALRASLIIARAHLQRRSGPACEARCQGVHDLLVAQSASSGVQSRRGTDFKVRDKAVSCFGCNPGNSVRQVRLRPQVTGRWKSVGLSVTAPARGIKLAIGGKQRTWNSAPASAKAR